MDFKTRFKEEFKGAFATNTIAEHNSLIWKSLPLWINYTDDNLIFIPGRYRNLPFYGANAFIYMIKRALNLGYDYVIYFDEDSFLVPNSETLLEELFLDFVKSDCVVAGCPDGGSFCHRNHNNLLINTFFSIWNIKALKAKNLIFLNALNAFFEGDTSFATFMRQVSKSRIKDMNKRSEKAREFSKTKNEELSKDFPDNEFPYCKIVKNNVKNPIEPHQVPYSFKQDDFEPYYRVLEFLVKFTNKSIYYFNCSDYADYGVDDKSKSGITSAVYDKSGEKLLLLHTWFSRDYTLPNSFHRKRIQATIDYEKNLNKK